MTSRVDITLSGTKYDPAVPVFGKKVLAARNGLISFVGQDVVDHTFLNASSVPWESHISVAGDAGWHVGDHIVVGTTSFSNYESEERTIVEISYDETSETTSITLDTALWYHHFGDLFSAGKTGEEKDFEMRAEVALLTRTIRFRGNPEDSQ